MFSPTLVQSMYGEKRKTFGIDFYILRSEFLMTQ